MELKKMILCEETTMTTRLVVVVVVVAAISISSPTHVRDLELTSLHIQPV
jgi:hypothetical protein